MRFRSQIYASIVGPLCLFAALWTSLVAASEVPFPPLPGRSLIGLISGSGVRYLPDGTKIRIENNNLLIERLDQRREIPLHDYFSIETVVGNTIVLSGYRDKQIRYLLVNRITGQRREISFDEKVEYGLQPSFFYYAIKPFTLRLIDLFSGKNYDVAVAAGEKRLNSLYGSEALKIYTLTGAKGPLLVYPDGRLVLHDLPESPVLTSCQQKKDFLSCQATVNEQSEDWMFFEKFSAFIKAPKDVKFIEVDAKTGKARFASQQTFVTVDLKSKEVKKIAAQELAAEPVFLQHKRAFLWREANVRGWFNKYDLFHFPYWMIWQKLEGKALPKIYPDKIGSFKTLPDLIEAAERIARQDLASNSPSPEPSNPGSWSYSIEVNYVRFVSADEPERPWDISTQANLVRMLEASHFALIEDNKKIILADLKNRKAYALNIDTFYQSTEYSSQYGTLLINDHSTKRLYDLKALAGGPWSGRPGSAMRWPKGPLSEKALQQCIWDPQWGGDQVSTRLAALRQLGEVIQEEELRELLTYILSPTELKIVGQIFQRYILEYGSESFATAYRLEILERLKPILDQVGLNPCLDDFAEQALRERLTEFRKSPESNKHFWNFGPLFAPYLRKFEMNGRRPSSITERPFVLEAVPGSAIVGAAGDGQVMVDGTHVTLNSNRDTLLLTKLGKQRRIPLFQSYSIKEARGQSVLLSKTSSSGDKNLLLVHIPTGSRTPVTFQAVEQETTYSDQIFYYSATHFYFFDFRHGLVQKRRRTILGGKPKANRLLSRNTGEDSLFHIPDAGGFLVSDSNTSSVQFVDAPNVPALKECSQHSDKLIFCETEDGRYLHFSGQPLQAYLGAKNETLISAQGTRAIYQNNKKEQFAHGFATNRRRELSLFSKKSLTTDLVWLASRFGKYFFVHWQMDNATLAKKTSFYQISRQDLWQSADSIDPMKNLLSAGKILLKGKDFDSIQKEMTNIFSKSTETQENTSWELTKTDAQVRFHHKNHPDQEFSINLYSKNIEVKLLQDTDFVLISNWPLFRMLLDLKSARIFDLGLSLDIPEYSAETQNLKVGSWLYSLPMLRAGSLTPTPTGFAARKNPGITDPASLRTCEIKSTDALTQNLLKMREIGQPVGEDQLRDILNYRLSHAELKIVAQVFQRLLLEQPDRASLMFRRLDLYDRLEPLAGQLETNPCLDDYANKYLLKALSDLVKLTDDQDAFRPVNFVDIAPNLVYAPYMEKFSMNSEHNREQLAERLAHGAQAHPMAAGIFYSKLYYIAEAAISPLFGKPRPFKTDITVLTEKRNAISLLMSTHPTTKVRTSRSTFGFYITMVDKTEVPQGQGLSFVHQVNWKSAGREYRADIKITSTANLQDMAPVTESLDHQALRKDKKLVGLMVVGSNLGKDHTKSTFKEYREFYENQGYKFAAAFDMAQFPSWMAENISKGEIDYLIKEAHSDGDEKNLFRSDVSVKMQTGRKMVGPIEEVIHLAAPDYENEKSSRKDELIANQIFGEWIRKREALGAGPLAYLNTSCSSFYKAILEIAAARSKNLVVIPSVNAITMFSTRADNATGILVKGLLNKKDWKTIRKEMNSNTEVALKRANLFALPNEPEFDKYVREALNYAIDPDVRIYDVRTGKQVNIDEFNHH